MARAARKPKSKTGNKRPSAAGKERKYTRDNAGRFASTGATARGVRLATATGNRRNARALAGHAKTIEATKLKATISKPKGLKPESTKAIAKSIAAKPKPTSKLRKRLNPTSKQPTQRTKPLGTISKNKNLRNADNREDGFMRKFARAYARRRKEGTPAQIARSEKTRGKALDIYQGAKRLDGTESTVGRFPRSRTSTGYKPLSSNIKSPKRFADSRIGVVPPIAKPIAKPAPIANPLAARAKAGSFRPGQLMSANAFPTNAIAKKPKIKHGYKDITPQMTQTQQRQITKNNVQIALDTAKKQAPWLPSRTKGDNRSGTVAFVALNLQTGGRRLQINSSHPRWKTPIKDSIQGRRSGEFASASPAHVINHEIGHAKHRTMGKQQFFQLGDTQIARRVSKYAATSANEFVAEVRGARKVGSRFDAQIMGKYRKYSGLSPKPAPRFRPTAKAKAAAAAKPAPKRNPQSKDAQADRLNVADRKKQAKALLEMPKPVRKAVRISLLAQRAGFAGAGVSADVSGRNKPRSSSSIASIGEGRMRLMGDSGRRKNKLTPGERQAINNAMVKSSRSLQARLRTTAIGARVKGMGGKTNRHRAKNNKTSTVSKPKGLKPGSIKATAKPAMATTKAKSPKFTTEQSGRVRRSALGGGRTAIVRKNSAVIINAKGEPIMTRKGLPNITAGKKYAANPNARGPRLMGRDRSEASPSRGYIRTSRPTGTTSKPKGLKPQNPATYGIAKTKTAKKEANDRLTKRYSNTPDQAIINIPGRHRGQAGKRFEASIDRAVATVAAARNAQFKTPAEVRATTAANKAAREAAAALKPKRTRTPNSLRTSRAKKVQYRRGISMNPTGWRPSSASRMAENAARTQSRALAFYKGKAR